MALNQRSFVDFGRREMKLSNTDLAGICYQLSVVFKSGLPISDGVKVLADEADNQVLGTVFDTIANKLDEGMSVSESFRDAAIFPHYMCEMFDVGENTGRLPNVLDELNAYYEGRARFQKKVRSAVTYPLVLLIMMTGVLSLLIFQVLPIFHEMLISLGGEVPAATQAVFQVASLLRGSMYVIIALLGLTLIFGFVLFKTKRFPRLRSSLLLRAPLIGKINRKNILVKLSRAITTLIASGYSFDMAVEKALPLIEDDVIQDRINAAINDIDNGVDALDSLRKVGVFPNLFYKMFRLGSKTGALEEMSRQFTENYQEELDVLTDRTADMIEPVLVTIMSIVVGVVLLMTLLPLIGIISAIG